MESGFEQEIVQWLSTFAYHPMSLYALIVLFMTLSSFGLPIPEEVVLISSGLIAYAGSRPDLYPPPTPDAAVVNLYTLSVVCFFAIFLSDLLVFFLGKFFGKKMVKSKRFGKWLDPAQTPRLNSIMKKYGAWASGIFRFTPGIRFPGHLTCGMVGVPTWKFVAIDGTAALVSVPTQVIFVGLYGEEILSTIKEFKIWLLSGLAVFGICFLLYRGFRFLQSRKTPTVVVKSNEAA